MSEPGDEATGMESRQGPDLHRRGDGVAEHRRHDAQTDGDARCCREGGRARRDTAREEAVLPQPQLVEPR
jgi:hypothetical protein